MAAPWSVQAAREEEVEADRRAHVSVMGEESGAAWKAQAQGKSILT
jgi:hypothetical protein